MNARGRWLDWSKTALVTAIHCQTTSDSTGGQSRPFCRLMVCVHLTDRKRNSRSQQTCRFARLAKITLHARGRCETRQFHRLERNHTDVASNRQTACRTAAACTHRLGGQPLPGNTGERPGITATASFNTTSFNCAFIQRRSAKLRVSREAGPAAELGSLPDARRNSDCV